ncbi:MAG: efflux RND transporter periplasmic adaptor subunit, partial [Armatimonadetes bacterium]|nr:efflux RND transporter periplasmic adaptor subunit [Armatimonadota bacterium]
ALPISRANTLQDAVRQSDIVQARAAVQQNSNDLAQLMVNLADTRIIAPASGLVLKKYKEPTEIVQSATTGFSDAQSIVATLGDRLLVRVGINEVDISKVRLGAPVTIHVDALSGRTLTGHVISIAPASTSAFPDSTGAGGAGGSAIAKFSVKVAFDRADPRLRPGMSAAVDILSAQRRRVILAPLEAVLFAGNAGTVTVLTPVGRQEKRKVTLGLRNDTSVEVRSGLRAGEHLVVPEAAGRRKLDIGPGNND